MALKRAAKKKQYTKRHSKGNRSYTTSRKKRRVRISTVRSVGVKGLKGKGVASLADQAMALQRLEKAKYVVWPKACPRPHCNGNLSKPILKKGRPGFFHKRCTSFGCRSTVAAYENSPFKGSRLNAAQLWCAIDGYTNNGSLKKPSTDTLCSSVEAGRFAVLKVTDALRGLVAKDAKIKNAKGTVSGDLEVDGHAVKSFHVSKTNPHFRHLHPKTTDNSKRALRLRKAPYFLCYLRVLGLRKRGAGKIYLAIGDFTLLPPRSVPPPENTVEVVKSKLLSRAKAGSVLHFDGAHAWPAAVEKAYKHKKFKIRKVIHKKMQFVAKCRRTRLSKSILSASLTGTQAIDSTWRTVNSYTHLVKTKVKDKSLNPRLYTAVYEWLWWANRPNQNGFDACGDLVAQWRAAKL